MGTPVSALKLKTNQQLQQQASFHIMYKNLILALLVVSAGAMPHGPKKAASSYTSKASKAAVVEVAAVEPVVVEVAVVVESVAEEDPAANKYAASSEESAAEEEVAAEEHPAVEE